MKRLIALMMCAVSFGAAAQVTYPYNPDEDGNGQIAVGDLQGILATYGNAFLPSEIQINGVGLLQVIEDLQNQLGAIQGIDVNYVQSTLEALEEEIDQLQAENQDLNDQINNLDTQVAYLSAHQDYNAIDIAKMKYVSDSLSLYNDYMWSRLGAYFESPFYQSVETWTITGCDVLNEQMGVINSIIDAISGVSTNFTPVPCFDPLDAERGSGEAIFGDLLLAQSPAWNSGLPYTYSGGIMGDEGAFQQYLGYGLSNVTTSGFSINSSNEGYYLGLPSRTDFGPHDPTKRFFSWPREVEGISIEPGISVDEIDLSGANLVGADLSGAVLQNGNFSGAFLMNADLEGANFQNSNFKGATLSKANLRNTVFWGANFSGVNLSGSALSLEHAELLGASNQIIIDGIKIDDYSPEEYFETIETIESDEDYENFLNSELYQVTPKLPYGWVLIPSADPTSFAIRVVVEVIAD